MTIRLSDNKIQACCGELLDGIFRGIFILEGHKPTRNPDRLVFSSGLHLFYTATRFCPYCGKVTTVECTHIKKGEKLC